MDKYCLLNYQKYLNHCIKYEIFDSFPRLDENEEKVRGNLIKNGKYDKRELKTFCDFVKKRYHNFPQLGYLEYETLDEFFTLQKKLFSQKQYYRSQFSFINMLFMYYSKEKKYTQTDFENKIYEKFNLYTSSCLSEIDPEWSIIEINENFLKKLEDPQFHELFLYNSELFLPQIMLTIPIYTKRITEEIKFFIMNRKNMLTNLIISFTDRKEEKNGKIEHIGENGDSNDNVELLFNKFMAQVLEGLSESESEKLKCLSIISEIGLLKLNVKNTSLFSDFVEKSKNLEILIMDSIGFSSQFEVVSGISNNKQLKFLSLQESNLNNITMEQLENKYDKDSKICFLRFNEDTFLDYL